jgi:hypothetical protein
MISKEFALRDTAVVAEMSEESVTSLDSRMEALGGG